MQRSLEEAVFCGVHFFYKTYILRRTAGDAP